MNAVKILLFAFLGSSVIVSTMPSSPPVDRLSSDSENRNIRNTNHNDNNLDPMELLGKSLFFDKISSPDWMSWALVAMIPRSDGLVGFLE